eukprot:7781948-Pyramimonas_sp.AAC.1
MHGHERRMHGHERGIQGHERWTRRLTERVNAAGGGAHLVEAAVALATAHGPKFNLNLKNALGWSWLTLLCGFTALRDLNSQLEVRPSPLTPLVFFTVSRDLRLTGVYT